LLQAALDAVPEPLFVASDDLKIVYVNGLLQSMLAYDNAELLDLSVEDILPTKRGWTASRAFADLTHRAQPLRLGLDKVIYARPKSGPDIRVFVTADSRETAFGTTISALVRNFGDEVDTQRRFASTCVGMA